MSEWTDWLEKQTPETILPLRIRTMHRLYGKKEDHRCKECKFFLVMKYSGTYFKCLKSKLTHGSATDWRANWTACGIFEPEEVTNVTGNPAASG